MPQPWIVLLDFDGTITARDADFAIADAALGARGEQAYRDNAAAYERLEISVDEYFERYLDILRITPQRFAELSTVVELRPGVVDFVRWCQSQGLDLKIVSEGLDVYILPLLKHHGIDDVTISCNRALYDGEYYRVLPALDGEPCARCLTCKGYQVKRARAAGFRVALVGNGASDLCGAEHAERVLARDSLLQHCQNRDIACQGWQSFADVQSALQDLVAVV